MDNNEYGTDVWGKVCKNFDDAFWECMKTGESAKMIVGDGVESVTIEIYRSKGTMKKFDEFVLQAVKSQTGIDLVKP